MKEIHRCKVIFMLFSQNDPDDERWTSSSQSEIIRYRNAEIAALRCKLECENDLMYIRKMLKMR